MYTHTHICMHTYMHTLHNISQPAVQAKCRTSPTLLANKLSDRRQRRKRAACRKQVPQARLAGSASLMLELPRTVNQQVVEQGNAQASSSPAGSRRRGPGRPAAPA